MEKIGVTMKTQTTRQTEDDLRIRLATAEASAKVFRSDCIAQMDKLEQVEAERDQLRAALEALDLLLDFSVPVPSDGDLGDVEDPTGINAAYEMAHAALNPQDCQRQAALGGEDKQ